MRNVPAVLQGMNKVATAAQLRYNTAALPEEVKQRLHLLAGGRITQEGWLVIDARQYRTQEQNRADALLRLVELLRQAARRPKPRRQTRPSVAARAERLDEKRRRSNLKHLRRTRPGEQE